MAGATARGEAAKEAWVKDGEVVPCKLLAHSWGVTPRTIWRAVECGELFAVLVHEQRYFVKEFLGLSRAHVSAICKELRGLDASEQFTFWKRQHGSLGDKTILQMFQDSPCTIRACERAIELAQAKTAQLKASSAKEHQT